MQAKLLSIEGETSWRHLTFGEGELYEVNPASSSQGSRVHSKGAACLINIGRVICSGEAKYATPQDLSTLLRWS